MPASILRCLGEGCALPRLRFGTWVGGDRDGHPLVTAQTTRETLTELRMGGLEVLTRQLSHLAGRLCLSENVQKPPRRSRRGSRG